MNTIQTVKEMRNIETGVLIGYLVNSTKSVPLAAGNRDFQEVQDWIAEGNTPEPAYTAAELLANRKNQHIAEINMVCEAEIVSGFISSALGTEHLYQSHRDDQTNLLGAVVASTNMSYRCSSDAGKTWEWKNHTAEQIKQVFDDGVAIKTALLQKAATLKAQIKAATASKLESIAW